MVTRPLPSAAIAGLHSSPVDALTTTGGENRAPFWLAAKIAALPFLQPCQATQTRPCESVAATTSMSEPGAELSRTLAPGLPLSIIRPQTSKLPLSFCDQKTHTRPE